jgi:hypothetical protein
MSIKNLTVEKFGKLTVVSEAEQRGGHMYWNCLCECGNTKVVRGSHLQTGNVRSCGCLPARRTHGETHTRLYVTWHNMKQRCENPRNAEFSRYGRRGITVCEEWANSFEAFRNWALANGYRDDLTIEREDNDGPYSPDNCRWATQKEQANNTRKTRFLTHNGQTRSVSEWARILGINQSTLNMRLNKYNWSVEKALSEGVKKRVS